MSRTVRLAIPDLSCQHCVQAVTAALRQVEGVEDVDVSLEGTRATVQVSDAVQTAALAGAVRAAGYTPHEVGG